MKVKSDAVVKDIDRGYKKAMDVISGLYSCYTSVGLHAGEKRKDGGDLPMIGSVHEFGVDKTVNGRRILIPERSWMRSWVDKNKKASADLAQVLYKQILDGKITVMQGVGLIGEFAVGGIQQNIDKIMEPPLKPATIAKKGSSKPLIDSGQMKGSVEHKEHKGRKPK